MPFDPYIFNNSSLIYDYVQRITALRRRQVKSIQLAPLLSLIEFRADHQLQHTKA